MENTVCNVCWSGKGSIECSHCTFRDQGELKMDTYENEKLTLQAKDVNRQINIYGRM